VQQDQELVLVEPYVQSADEDLHRQQAGERPGVAREHAAANGHDHERDHEQRCQVHERAVREVDVHELRLAERHELTIAGRELLATRVVGPVAELVVRPAVVLGARHVAAGDDGAQHGDARNDRERPQPRPAVHRPRAAHGAPEVEQQAEQQHRESQVRRDVGLLEVLLDGRTAEGALRDHEHEQRGGRREQRAVPPPCHHEDRQDHEAHDDRERSVRVLDDRVEVHSRHDVAVAERPAVEARPRRAAAEARVGHADHAAHDDEDEGRDPGRED
jgi:hypothetical protein